MSCSERRTVQCVGRMVDRGVPAWRDSGGSGYGGPNRYGDALSLYGFFWKIIPLYYEIVHAGKKMRASISMAMHLFPADAHEYNNLMYQPCILRKIKRHSPAMAIQ